MLGVQFVDQEQIFSHMLAGDALRAFSRQIRAVHVGRIRGTGAVVRSNVGAKPAPTVGRQARAVENVERHRPGLVARRWGSA